MKVAIIGQGYVGLPLAIAIAESGIEVTGIDIDPIRINKLKSGLSISEDVKDSQIRKLLDSNKYTPTSSYSEINSADIILICVPTPLSKERKPDLTFVLDAARSIGPNINNHPLIILESSVAPGTTSGILRRTLEEFDRPFDLAYSPERIDPTNKERTIRNTPKLVAGIDSASTLRAEIFYKNFIEKVITAKSPEIIEASKLLENSFRLVNISLINEMAMYCEKVGINIIEVINAAATKPYGFMPFYPSIGVGGHCIPVDPIYLADSAKNIGIRMDMILTADLINQSRPKHFIELAKSKLGTLMNKSILVIGISYKAGVSDTRESASLTLIHQLRSLGANVDWNDDLVLNWNGEKSSQISNKYDLVFIANVAPNFKITEVDQSKIIDTRGLLT